MYNCKVRVIIGLIESVTIVADKHILRLARNGYQITYEERANIIFYKKKGIFATVYYCDLKDSDELVKVISGKKTIPQESNKIDVVRKKYQDEKQTIYFNLPYVN